MMIERVESQSRWLKVLREYWDGWRCWEYCDDWKSRLEEVKNGRYAIDLLNPSAIFSSTLKVSIRTSSSSFNSETDVESARYLDHNHIVKLVIFPEAFWADKAAWSKILVKIFDLSDDHKPRSRQRLV